MLNLLVETKNEYISHLTNILTPLIFEGLQSIYKEAQKMSDATDVLKIFQTFLKRIPKWNQNLIEKETERIINSSHSYGWLGDLIKATLKSSLIILMYNPTKKTQEKVDSSFYKNISTEDFIHKVYIECAREIWNNPYLLYHNYPPIEIKRNQRDCMNIIKDCIKEALRKLLPVKHILSIYLGEDIEKNNDNNFEKTISDADEKNLTKIINKDLSEEIKETNKEIEYKNYDKIFDKNAKYEDSKSDTKTIGSKILNIIKPSKTSMSFSNINEEQMITDDKTSSSSEKSSMVIDKKSETSSISGSLDNDTSELDSEINKSIKKLEKDLKPHNNLDNEIKKILNNDLVESDFDTNLSLTDMNENKYQEIFSNSISNSNNKVNDNKTNQLFKKFMQY